MRSLRPDSPTPLVLGRRALRSAALVLALTFLSVGALVSAGARAPSDTEADETGWELGTPEPHPDGRTDVLENYEELSCAACHTEIAAEWAHSRHALAWVDERYQKDLEGRKRARGCHGCHIPDVLHMGDMKRRPKPRDESDVPHHFGISCQSCHLGPDDEILGPWGHETPAHATRKSPSFTPEGKSQLCISCHRTTIGPVIGIAKDFVTTDQASKGKSCVGCHMAPVERPVAIDPGGDETYPVRSGRSHLLQTPRDPGFLRRAFEFSANRSDGKTAVTIANPCGHRVPGLQERRLEFTIEVLDAGGAVAGQASFSLDHRAYLPVDGTQIVNVEAQGPRVRVRGLHYAPGFEQPLPFMDETFDVIE